jgi:Fic family protein
MLEEENSRLKRLLIATVVLYSISWIAAYASNKLLYDFEGKLKTSKWAKMTKCSTDTALRDIKDLIDKGVLKQESEGGRSTNYELVKI